MLCGFADALQNQIEHTNIALSQCLATRIVRDIRSLVLRRVARENATQIVHRFTFTWGGFRKRKIKHVKRNRCMEPVLCVDDMREVLSDSAVTLLAWDERTDAKQLRASGDGAMCRVATGKTSSCTAGGFEAVMEAETARRCAAIDEDCASRAWWNRGYVRARSASVAATSRASAGFLIDRLLCVTHPFAITSLRSQLGVRAIAVYPCTRVTPHRVVNVARNDCP